MKYSLSAFLFFLLLPCTLRSQEMIMLFDDYQDGRVFMKNRAKVNVRLNFDTAGQKIYFYQDETLMEMTNCHLIDTIFVAGRKFVWKDDRLCEYVQKEYGTVYINWKFREIPVGRKGAMGLTTQGKVESYYVPGLNSTHSLESRARYRDDTEVFETKNDNTYYFSIDGREYTVRRIQELYKSFPDYAEQLKKWSKNNHIQMLNASDALKVIDFLQECIHGEGQK